MKNKKILLVIGAISLLSLTIWITSAATIDCSTIDRDEFMTIMQKQESWQTLTDDEQELVDSMESCMPERPDETWSGRVMWDWGNAPELTDEQKAQMEEMQAIMEKQKNWETLTDEEQELLDNFQANRGEMSKWWMEQQYQETDSSDTSKYTNLTTAYKSKVETAFSKVETSIS